MSDSQSSHGSNNSDDSSVLMSRIRLILKGAFSADFSQCPDRIEEVAIQLKEAYKQKPQD